MEGKGVDMYKLPNVGSDASKGIQTWTGTILGSSLCWERPAQPALKEGRAQFMVEVFPASLREGCAQVSEAFIRLHLEEMTDLAVESVLRGCWENFRLGMIAVFKSGNAEVASGN